MAVRVTGCITTPLSRLRMLTRLVAMFMIVVRITVIIRMTAGDIVRGARGCAFIQASVTIAKPVMPAAPERHVQHDGEGGNDGRHGIHGDRDWAARFLSCPEEQ